MTFCPGCGTHGYVYVRVTITLHCDHLRVCPLALFPPTRVAPLELSSSTAAKFFSESSLSTLSLRPDMLLSLWGCKRPGGQSVGHKDLGWGAHSIEDTVL